VFNIPDLVYDTAHGYPGGVPALATRYCTPHYKMSPNVLSKKVDPDVHSHWTTVEELIKMIHFTGDHRVVHGFAAMVGAVLVYVEDLEHVNDMELLETYTEVMSVFGEFSKLFHVSLADRKITRPEYLQMKAAWHKLQSAAMTLLGRIESLIDEE